MRQSERWAKLGEEKRDDLRGRLRRLVGMGQQVIGTQSPSRQLLIRAADAALMADDVEMGLCIGLLLGLQEEGLLDRGHESLTRIMEGVVGVPDSILIDHERN